MKKILIFGLLLILSVNLFGNIQPKYDSGIDSVGTAGIAHDIDTTDFTAGKAFLIDNYNFFNQDSIKFDTLGAYLDSTTHYIDSSGYADFADSARIAVTSYYADSSGVAALAYDSRGLTLLSGDTILILSPGNADTNKIYSTVDTTYFNGDLPLKFGNASLVVADNYATFGGDVKIASGDTLETDYIVPSNGHIRIGLTGDTIRFDPDDIFMDLPVVKSDTVVVILPDGRLARIDIDSIASGGGTTLLSYAENGTFTTSPNALGTNTIAQG